MKKYPGYNFADLSVMTQLQDYTQIIAQHAKTHAVLVDFYATWCPPCQKILPILEAFGQDPAWTSFVRVVKINIDEYPGIATEYRIQSLPTLVLIQKHAEEVKEIARNIGALSESGLHQWLDQYQVRNQ